MLDHIYVVKHPSFVAGAFYIFQVALARKNRANTTITAIYNWSLLESHIHRKKRASDKSA
jgi:hypothetical protein